MSILQEVIKTFHRLDDETSDTELPNDSGNTDDGDDLELDLPSEIDGDELDDAPADNANSEDISLDGEDPQIDQELPDPNMPNSGTDPQGNDQEGGMKQDDDLAIDGEVESQQSEDPNKQGVIRTVKGAHLVYKRACGDGGFEELWMYNIGTLKDELEIRKAILSGTDIPTNKTSSEDGSQTYTIWSAGNAELVHVTGLQN